MNRRTLCACGCGMPTTRRRYLYLRGHRPVPPVTSRFYKFVAKNADGDCWVWTGAIDSDGYSQIKVGGRTVRAHRVSYELHVGPIPDGLQIDHLCRVRRCVNPEHLEPVTNRENQIRGISFSAVNAAKTHCPAGHPYDEANTYMVPSRPGNRRCRACGRASGRAESAA